MMCCVAPAWAQKAGRPVMSYDVSGGVGSYDGNSYSEIHLGLNWPVYDWLNWRNAIFTQFGSSIKSVYGLDSSLLLQSDFYNQNRTAGVEFFAGPGVRVATEKSNAAFVQGGITFALAGLRLGVGAQALTYFADRTDKNDAALPKDEVHYFITISGGGTL
ncbi:hypothetical protein D3C87_299930 [compost metagenome]